MGAARLMAFDHAHTFADKGFICSIAFQTRPQIIPCFGDFATSGVFLDFKEIALGCPNKVLRPE